MQANNRRADENDHQVPDPQTEGVLTFGEEIHAFPVIGGGVLLVPASHLPQTEDTRTRESTLLPSEEQEISQMVAPPFKGPLEATKARPLLVPALLLLVNLALALAVLFLDVWPTWTQSVTITIVPTSHTLTTRLTLSHVASRVFAPLLVKLSTTVVTTGNGHQEATAARGLLTFYNAAPQAQTIAAGTLLTGADGVQVVIDQAAYLEASLPPTETQATVPAHAVTPGGAGDIPAGAITGACCRLDILVTSAAFHGGQDERDYPMVTRQDIQRAASSLLPTLTQKIHAAVEKLREPQETLIPPVCAQQLMSDHGVGEEATTVRVTIKQSCREGAYNPNDYASQVSKALAAQVGKEYSVLAYLLVSAVQAALKQQSMVLSAIYQARVLYHFSQAEQDAWHQELRGKSRTQATRLLSQVPGVAKISITTPANQQTLPTDAASLHVVIVSP